MNNNTYLLLEKAFAKLSAAQLVEFSEVFGEVFENISDAEYLGEDSPAANIIADVLEIIGQAHGGLKQ